jgi:hypothetical protein
MSFEISYSYFPQPSDNFHQEHPIGKKIMERVESGPREWGRGPHSPVEPAPSRCKIEAHKAVLEKFALRNLSSERNKTRKARLLKYVILFLDLKRYSFLVSEYLSNLFPISINFFPAILLN